MAFDPKKLKEHAKKGKFKDVETKKDAPKEDSTQSAVRAQQDLLTTRLKQTLRKDKGKLPLPNLYKIKGKQVDLYQDALESIGSELKVDSSEEYWIDRTGFCPQLILENVEKGASLDYLGNSFVIISPEQSSASIVNPKYSFLDRLLDDVFKEQSGPVESFTKCEPIVGTITNTVIEQGVERFLKEGGYKEKDAVDVVANIETPSKAMGSLRVVKNGIKDIESVHETVTDIERIKGLYETSSELKRVHKKLADLQLSDKDKIDYEVKCFRYGDDQLELFYFKTEHKPVFVFFAKDKELEDSIEDHFDPEFIILNGNDESKLLNNLMDMKMLDYLVEFVESTRDTYATPKAGKKKGGGIMGGLKSMTGKGETTLSEDWHRLNDIASVLRLGSAEDVKAKIENYEILGDTANLENIKGQYIRSLPAETKTEVVFPVSTLEDKLVCELISKSCPSEAITEYGDTQKFIYDFSNKSEEEQIELLQEVDKEIKFENQNNLLVNAWLGVYHQDVCKKAGIEFYNV